MFGVLLLWHYLCGSGVLYCSHPIGHHMDDADENRLAELGKGNIIRVNGMTRLSECLGATVLRPLLHLRKAAMFQFADAAGIPSVDNLFQTVGGAITLWLPVPSINASMSVD
jgi:hypothetical protein